MTSSDQIKKNICIGRDFPFNPFSGSDKGTEYSGCQSKLENNFSFVSFCLYRKFRSYGGELDMLYLS